MASKISYADSMDEFVRDFKGLSRPRLSGGPSLRREVDITEEQAVLVGDVNEMARWLFENRLLWALADREFIRAFRGENGTLTSGEIRALGNYIRNKATIIPRLIREAAPDARPNLLAMASTRTPVVPGYRSGNAPAGEEGEEIGSPSGGEGDEPEASQAKVGALTRPNMESTETRTAPITETTYTRRPLSLRK